MLRFCPETRTQILSVVRSHKGCNKLLVLPLVGPSHKAGLTSMPTDVVNIYLAAAHGWGGFRFLGLWRLRLRARSFRDGGSKVSSNRRPGFMAWSFNVLFGRGGSRLRSLGLGPAPKLDRERRPLGMISTYHWIKRYPAQATRRESQKSQNLWEHCS